jgi:Rrf2 family protein
MLLDRNTRPTHSLLELSAKVEYALLALMELASHADRKNPLTINEIAARQTIPERYLEQIFIVLRRGGIVQSQRGARGGYTLARDPWQITVLDAIALVEGDRQERENSNLRSLERDLVSEIWQQANLKFQGVLSKVTLQELCQRRDAKKQKDPMYYI